MRIAASGNDLALPVLTKAHQVMRESLVRSEFDVDIYPAVHGDSVSGGGRKYQLARREYRVLVQSVRESLSDQQPVHGPVKAN
jgi:hypothetical protein